MNDAEYQHLKRQAKATGLGPEGLIRALVMGVQLRPQPPVEYAALLRQLSGIGTNLNQRTHKEIVPWPIRCWANRETPFSLGPKRCKRRPPTSAPERMHIS